MKSTQRVLVTGVFDILHQEHVTFLQKAKQLGYLVVAIECDERVKKIKGEGRPLNTQTVRQHNVEELGIADEVIILPEQFNNPDDHRRLLNQVKPTILAVSSHTAHLDRKQRLMQEIGGRVEVVHQHNPDISTTKIIDSMKHPNK
jgi:D-beta-D-heptose 7-phosphate kinase / D-beta-D-heptose 1-phosphate adenosyltransferase